MARWRSWAGPMGRAAIRWRVRGPVPTRRPGAASTGRRPIHRPNRPSPRLQRGSWAWGWAVTSGPHRTTPPGLTRSCRMPSSTMSRPRQRAWSSRPARARCARRSHALDLDRRDDMATDDIGPRRLAVQGRHRAGRTTVILGITFDPADTAGTTPLPVTWHLSGGVVTQSTLPGLPAAPSSITGLEWTPIGFVASVIQNDAGKSVASVWTSPDGKSWADSLDVSDGAVSTLSVSGADVLAFGANRQWQTSDGSSWKELPEPAFKGYYISAVAQLADGRLSAAGGLITASAASMPNVATSSGSPRSRRSGGPSPPTARTSVRTRSPLMSPSCPTGRTSWSGMSPTPRTWRRRRRGRRPTAPRGPG